jgi:predicted TIM-barrel fold metal-dependent hydrolase
MIIDINASLGHYPFMQLRHNTAEKLVALMDRNGINHAVVSNVHSAFYRDAHRGNAELAENIQPYRSRLSPVATINPKYVGWERDLEQCVTQWKMTAIALMPEHHGYRLTGELGQAAIRKIAASGLPLTLIQRLEDRRQRHDWDRAEDLEFGEVAAAVKAHPNLKVLLLNWIGLDGKKVVEAGLKGRCLISLARLEVVLSQSAGKLIDTLGAEAIAFGSHMPFNYVGPALVKLANLEALPRGGHELIAWQNAARFLKIRT